MKTPKSFAKTLPTAVLLFCVAGNLLADDKRAYSVKGMFVEGCTCRIPCGCELSGNVESGCEGVGAMSLSGGEFNGISLDGAKIVYAGEPGKWMRFYADAPRPEQRDAALNFAKTYYAEWGKCESATAARIDIRGADGNYTVLIDDGKIMRLTTEPVVGGDGKSPIKISNTKSALNPTFLQGRTLSGTYKDGKRSIELKNSNSYFNNKMNAKGEL